VSSEGVAPRGTDRASAETSIFPRLSVKGPSAWVSAHTRKTVMVRESTQQKLSRVRAPRVHITYDVQVGDAIENKEIPFVMGVLGDLSGQPEQPLAKVKDRKFVEITPDNFDTVLGGMNPRVAFAVENKLSEDPNAPQLKVDLRFKTLEDFEPEQVARQVKPLRDLLELRTKLSDLRGSLQGNDKLDELLLESITNTEKLEKLRAELNLPKPEGGPNE
jgi:type VI secretion system protein ImpB